MTDDVRLEQLSELARRAYGPTAVVKLGLRGADAWTAYIETDACEMLTIHAPSGSALDALEAALLVLDGQDTPLRTAQAKNVYSEAFLAAQQLYSKRIAELEEKLKRVRKWADACTPGILEESVLESILDGEDL